MVVSIVVAREYDWIETDEDHPTFQALNALVANVLSGGSIAEE